MKKKIKRVYVAGPLTPHGIKSANPAIEYLINISDMVDFSLEVMEAGYTPFCPALDFLYFLKTKKRITEAMIKKTSKDWLDVSDVMVLLPDWGKSTGTIAEIKRAKELGIPVFDTLEELIKYDTQE